AVVMSSDIVIIVNEESYRVCFFFSSRRRHTRSKRDWSSDVCSSDLKWLLHFLNHTQEHLSRCLDKNERITYDQPPNICLIRVIMISTSCKVNARGSISKWPTFA